MIRKEVLIIGNFVSQQGGTRSVCEDLAMGLETRGVLVLKASNKRTKIERLVDILLTIHSQRRRYSVAQIDVFSGNAFLLAEIAIWHLSRLQKPVILTLHGGGLPQFAQKWPRRVKRLLAQAAAVTAPSPYLQYELRPFRDDIRLLRNGLDLSRFNFRARSSLRPQLVWVRAFHNIYNPCMAPCLMALLLRCYPNARLEMIGPDHGDGSLAATRRLAERLGVAKAICFTGPVKHTDIPNVLERADIFINTTNVDNTPVSVLEAMAAGLCVVSTNAGGLPHMLHHEKNSVLVETGNAEQMAHWVVKLLSDPALAERISRGGRMTSQLHDWNLILTEWECLLDEIIMANTRHP